MSTPGTRPLLAVTALAAGILAAAAWATDRDAVAGVAMRVGAVLGALWVAWPSLERLGPRTLLWSLGAVLAVLWRPRAAWVVIPVLALVLRRRPPEDDNRD